MGKPITVIIPHRLGKAEASRRLKSGLASIRPVFGTKLAVLEEAWTGDRMEFRVALLGQAASGSIDVGDEDVRLSLLLPWALAILAEKAKALIQSQGHAMLEKK
jgi:hypothetical protein